jgi:hypothetical protein
MSQGTYTTQNMLTLRKLTRAVADLLRGHLKEYLNTLAYLFRPKTVFGDYVDSAKEGYRGTHPAFEELATIYESLATKKPFNLPKELKPPIEVVSGVPELTPLEYTHTAKTDRETKTVTVTAPLKWVLTYSGFGPKRLKEMLAGRPVGNEIQEYVLHAIMMHVVTTRQPGLINILQGLRFHISTGRLSGFGELPITFVTSSLGTIRPPDEVIIESTEIAGMDTFEEIVSQAELAELAALKDPVTEKLIELAKAYG